MVSSEFRKQLFRPKVDKFTLFAQLKANSNYDSFFKIVNANVDHPITRKLIFSNALPKEYKELREGRIVPYSGNFITELAWHVYSIKHFKEDINRYLLLKTEFDNNFLLENFENCTIQLRNIEENICKSLWSLENSFLLTEFKSGVESNWTLLSDFSRSIKNPLTLYFLENYSKKAETKITYFRFKNIFDNQMTEVDGPSEFREYLCFRLNYPAYVGFENFAYFLTVESISSIIDRYLLVRDILFEIIGSEDGKNKPIAEKVLVEISQCIEDPSLKQLINFSDIESKINPLYGTAEILHIFDKYTEGIYNECTSAIPSLLKKNPSCIELYEIYIKSLIESNSDFKKTGVSRFIDQLLEHLFNIYSRNSKSDESTEGLLKTILSFYSTNWAKQLFGLLCIQNNINREHKIYRSLYLLYSSINNPRFLNHMVQESQSFVKSFNFFENNFSSNKAVLVNKAINKGLIDLLESYSTISIKRKALYVGRALIKLDRKIDAKLHYENLLNKDDLSVSVYEEAIENLFNIYLDTKSLREATILFVENFLKNANLTINLRRESLLEALDVSGAMGVENYIDLPIFFKLASSDSYKQYVAYDIFISQFDIERPSDLISIKEKFPISKFIYFLKEVCTSEILHHSYVFEGTDDIENERLILLRELILIDKENESLYIKEVTEISQNSTIRKAIREINKGRITVNVQQLKNIESVNIKEGFNRYKELSEYTKNKEIVAVDASSKLINDYLSSINEDKVKDNIVYTNDPAFITFKLMFLEMRDKFILSNEFGLDGYLSTRIRHGTLLNHIRSIFETLNLLSQKGQNGEYFDNDYWNDKIPYNLLEKRDSIQNALKSFTKNIDNFTEQIIRELIQIKTEKNHKKPNALFDYSISQQELAYLFATVRSEIKDYSIFIDFVFDFLEEKTRIILTNIRNLFNSGLKEQYNQIILDFQHEIKSIVGEYSFVDLTSSIAKCSTYIQDEINNISEWFYLSNPSANLTLDLKTVIQSSLEITNSIYPSNRINPKTIKVDFDFPINGAINLIYIVKILLDNIIIHSGLQGDEKEVEIISEFEEEDSLKLIFKNKIAKEKNNEEIIKTLQQVKNTWQLKREDFQKLTAEGGSGFDKIRKILAFDMQRANYDFDFDLHDNYLTLSIKFDVQFTQYET